MTPDELKSASLEIWGERGWVAALASSLGIDRTQVWRYINSRSPLPGPVAAAIACWLAHFRHTGEKPPEKP